MKLRECLFAALVLICGGCSSVAVHRIPGADVRKYQHFFVEHNLNDDHRVDDVIVAELRALGRDAAAGPLTLMPDNTDVIVTYDDQWAWDFKDYLLQLTVEMHDIRKERLLATGVYRQPTPLSKPPEFLAQTILARLFRQHRQGIYRIDGTGSRQRRSNLNALCTPGVSVVIRMKKLPLCALAFSALFAIAGTVALAKVAPRPEPFPLFFPLMWDLVMVALGLGIILRRDCARRAGVAWGIFCILASIAIGVTALGWLWPQGAEPMGTHRLVFMILAVSFGLIFGVWQLMTFNGPELKAWTDHTHDADRHHSSDTSHGAPNPGHP